MTNFERIMSMDIDEFASYLCSSDVDCRTCIYEDMNCYGNPKIKCIEGIREYLESEVEE